MFYRLAMRSIQARAGISTDKIGALGKSWSSRFSVSGRNKLKLELQRALGPMDSDELTSFIGVAHQNPACQSREAALVSGHE
jgi:hypothetical protein